MHFHAASQWDWSRSETGVAGRGQPSRRPPVPSRFQFHPAGCAGPDGETKPVDVVALVREAVADFGAAGPDRPVTQAVDGAAIVQGDRVRLRQVVDNLLANARSHTPAGTPVHVAVARKADHVELSVRDEGPGIAAADQARVFERFWRADPGRVRSTGGTGLGLAIVASLVEAHGGTVGVTSQPGHGATFTVRLPLEGATTTAATSPLPVTRAAARPTPSTLAAARTGGPGDGSPG